MIVTYVFKGILLSSLVFGLFPTKYVVVAENCGNEYKVCLATCKYSKELAMCINECKKSRGYCLELMEESE